MRQKQSIFSLFLLSPSSRRAWIEIFTASKPMCGQPVALLAEGMDRNVASAIYRARIEISTIPITPIICPVA